MLAGVFDSCICYFVGFTWKCFGDTTYVNALTVVDVFWSCRNFVVTGSSWLVFGNYFDSWNLFYCAKLFGIYIMTLLKLSYGITLDGF